MKMKTPGIGFLGCGEMARIHARCLKQIPGAKLIAAYDRSSEAGRAFGEEFGCSVAHSLEQLLAQPDVNAVYICTWHDSHTALIEQSIKSGKQDIFCEKPMALTMDDARRIHDLVRAQRVQFMIGLNHRFTPSTVKLKELLEAGRLHPNIVSITFACAPFMDTWAGQPEQGGILTNLGSHAFDLARWVVGDEVVEVSCFAGRTRLGPVQAEDSAVATLRFRNGAMATCMLNDQAPASYSVLPGRNMVRIEVFGTEGFIVCRGLDGLDLILDGRSEQIACDPYDQFRSWGYLDENRRFIQTISSEEHPSPNEEDGLKAVELVEAARVASAEHRVVAIGC
jgi:myo-inositol 2-dehydrogenase/D-chiro-inositol 1-dehydrogenase